MNLEAPCPKCGTTRWVPHVRVLDRGEGNAVDDLRLGVDRSPDALVFKRRVATALYAAVCGACGYAELYADDPEALYRAYLESDA